MHFITLLTNGIHALHHSTNQRYSRISSLLFQTSISHSKNAQKPRRLEINGILALHHSCLKRYSRTPLRYSRTSSLLYQTVFTHSTIFAPQRRLETNGILALHHSCFKRHSHTPKAPRNKRYSRTPETPKNQRYPCTPKTSRCQQSDFLFRRRISMWPFFFYHLGKFTKKAKLCDFFSDVFLRFSFSFFSFASNFIQITSLTRFFLWGPDFTSFYQFLFKSPHSHDFYHLTCTS